MLVPAVSSGRLTESPFACHCVAICRSLDGLFGDRRISFVVFGFGERQGSFSKTAL